MILLVAFSMYDLNKNNYITREEFKFILNMMVGSNITTDQVGTYFIFRFNISFSWKALLIAQSRRLTWTRTEKSRSMVSLLLALYHVVL